MSDPTAEANVVERARQQIRRLADEIAACSQQDDDPATYFAAFLPRVVEALAAVGGAVWRPNPDGTSELIHQVNLKSTLLDKEGEHQRRHALLVMQAARSTTGMLVAPHAGSGSESHGANPTELLLVLAPVTNQTGVMAVVEVFQRPTTQADTRQGYLNFLNQMCQVASGWATRLQRGAERQQLALFQNLDAFAKRVHGHPQVAETTFAIANEGQRFLACDRVGVATWRGGRCRLVSVSGQDQLEPRSDTVQALERLVYLVIKYGEDFTYPLSDESAIPPQLEVAAENYLDGSLVKTVSILLLRRSEQAEASAERSTARTVIGALVLEQIEDERATAVLAGEAALLMPHAEVALSTAIQHEDIFLVPLLRRLSRGKKLFSGQTRWKTIAVSLLLVAAVLALVFIPAPFYMEAPGVLQPREQRDVFVGVDGQVSAVHVEHGAKVTEGQLLLELQNPDLEVQLAQTQGQLHEVTQRLLAAERLRHQDGLSKEEQNRLAGEVLSLEQQIDSLQLQTDLLVAKQKRLKVNSPIAGQVVTWNLNRNLLQRPVSAGQVVMSLANPSGEWELEVFVPEKRMGHLAEFQAQHPGPLEVLYVVAADPSQVNRGTTREFHALAELHEEHGNSVSLLVDIDKSTISELHPGLSVTAHVKCGSRSLGYVWLHEVWEFVQAKILFNLW